MDRSGSKFIVMLALAALPLAATLGCGDDGDDLPADAVAKVGDVVIERSEFDKWFKLIVLSPFLPGQGFVSAPPNPPSFSNCIAAKKQDPASKQPGKPSDQQLKNQCRREYAELKRETMQTLLESEWAQQEAAARNVTVSAETLTRIVDESKESGFPSERAYQQFLKSSGMAERDFRFRIKIQELQEELEQRIAEGVQVSEEDIAAHYRKNRQEFVDPERRDFTYVRTKTAARAERAKQAVEADERWSQVVKRYSIAPEGSQAQVIKTPEPEEGLEALERGVLRTGRGEIGGPVRVRRGWYVFEVTKVTPASPQSLAEVKDAIAARLRERRQVAALEQYVRKYRDKTVCADAFKATQCSNGPEEEAS